MPKLKDLLNEVICENTKKQPLTTEEKRKLLEMVKGFNSLGEYLYRKNSLIELSTKINEITESTARLMENEGYGWFEEVTIKEDMKHLNNNAASLSKLAESASVYENRMKALYENMYHILERYFDLKTNNPENDKKQ